MKRISILKSWFERKKQLEDELFQLLFSVFCHSA